MCTQFGFGALGTPLRCDCEKRDSVFGFVYVRTGGAKSRFVGGRVYVTFSENNINI